MNRYTAQLLLQIRTHDLRCVRSPVDKRLVADESRVNGSASAITIRWRCPPEKALRYAAPRPGPCDETEQLRNALRCRLRTTWARQRLRQRTPDRHARLRWSMGSAHECMWRRMRRTSRAHRGAFTPQRRTALRWPRCNADGAGRVVLSEPDSRPKQCLPGALSNHASTAALLGAQRRGGNTTRVAYLEPAPAPRPSSHRSTGTRRGTGRAMPACRRAGMGKIASIGRLDDVAFDSLHPLDHAGDDAESWMININAMPSSRPPHSSAILRCTVRRARSWAPRRSHFGRGHRIASARVAQPPENWCGWCRRDGQRPDTDHSSNSCGLRAACAQAVVRRTMSRPRAHPSYG